MFSLRLQESAPLTVCESGGSPHKKPIGHGVGMHKPLNYQLSLKGAVTNYAPGSLHPPFLSLQIDSWVLAEHINTHSD